MTKRKLNLSAKRPAYRGTKFSEPASTVQSQARRIIERAAAGDVKAAKLMFDALFGEVDDNADDELVVVIGLPD